MTEHPSSEPTDGAPDGDDEVLAAAGARLRASAPALSAPAIEASVLRRRSRRLGLVASAACVAVVALAGVLVVDGSDGADRAAPADSGASAEERNDAEMLLARLPDQPVDPTEVQLVSTVSTFGDCDALIGDLRQVGAEHVGSRGFGASSGFFGPFPDAYRSEEQAAATGDFAAPQTGNAAGGDGGGATLGTNVQVVGVDELDHVKAVGDRIFDLDGDGNLRITDATSLEVIARVDVTPAPLGGGVDDSSSVDQLLADADRVVVFGTETEVSEPVEGDPSAAQAATSFLTVAFVDVSDGAEPSVTDRVRVEGRLVSARLVDGEIRLVTTSDMDDLGFVLPTTPTSVAKALEQNRRSVALSSAADWIPDWQREGDDPTPLVPCERVHVPDTFAGVAMTSMVTFPMGTGIFEPTGTSILAPGDTLYAGLDRVAISAGVWVDPIDRDRIRFDDWQTAIHEFSFTDGDAPGYQGSGIVDGSTVGQFAFGEIGDALGVVTTIGTPWAQDTSNNAVDLVVLTPDGEGALDRVGEVEDLADGEGQVSAVRFVDGRVLVGTGVFGHQVRVVDVSDPATPRKGGEITVPGPIGYFHPLPDNQALLVGSRSDEVGSGNERRTRQWVQAHLLDVADPDAPRIVSTWERPWSVDQVGFDHHAFTYWPDRDLALWGIQDTQGTFDGDGPPNVATVLRVDGDVAEVAVPAASKPNETPPPCEEVAVSEAGIRDLVGPNGRVLRCDGGGGDGDGDDPIEWPRYQCYRVDPGTVAQFVPDAPDGDYAVCNPAPQPTVSRVLVVDGRPILLTDQTLEALDPETFASTQIVYHPGRTGQFYG